MIILTSWRRVSYFLVKALDMSYSLVKVDMSSAAEVVVAIVAAIDLPGWASWCRIHTPGR